MAKETQAKLNRYAKKRSTRRKWLSAIASLCAVVAVCTSYVLINPASTQQKETFCGLEEHKEHTEACYSSALVCTLSEEGHAHTDECYEEQTTLVCTLPESEGHTHTDACYGQETYYACGLEEAEGHTHGDACCAAERVLVCTDESEDHVHTDECYEEQTTLVCTLPESEGHTHSEACEATRPVLLCTLEEAEPHQHTEACYETQRVLICPLEEAEPHTHSEECYAAEGKELTCALPIHEHTLQCFSDPNADVETAAVWERTLARADLTGCWGEDVLAVAETQLGYTESKDNYEVQEDGTTVKGYTRYGAWYGVPYGDWCAMFCSFCMNYAGIPQSAIPYCSNCDRWVEALSSEAWSLYRPAGEYTPVPGDLVFFDRDGNRVSEHVGLVYAVEGGKLTTIEGNSANCVAKRTYTLEDTGLMGYGAMPRNPEAERTVSLAMEDGVTVTVTGALPQGAEIRLQAIEPDTLEGILAQVPAKQPVFAWDITIVDEEGGEWQPGQLGARVSIAGLSIPENEAVEVVHVPEEGEMEEILPRVTQEGVEFTVSGFSPLLLLLDEDEVLMVAASDFQDPATSYSSSKDFAKDGDYSAQTARLKAILQNIEEEYGTAYGFIAGGDYGYDLADTSSTKTQKGLDAVESAVTDIFGTGVSTVFIQGNHDKAVSDIAASGAHDTDHYGVFVLNEDDYSYKGGSESTVSALAGKLETYLSAKVSEGFDKPVFLASHIPLHFSCRTAEDGDAKYADTLFDVITEYADDLNIFFLYGHNHAYGDDDHLGGSSVFLTRGDTINIAQHGSQSKYTEETLNFTYMNYGYTGYYWTCGHPDAKAEFEYDGEADDTLTMTSFVISGSDVTVSRWDESGVHALKHVGAPISYDSRGMDEVCPVTTNSVSSPKTVTLTSGGSGGNTGGDDGAGDEEELYPIGTSQLLSTWDCLISAREVTAGTDYSAVQTMLNGVPFTLYDITKKDGSTVPDKGVQVYLPVEEEMRVFGVEDGALQWYSTRSVTLDGQLYMVFTAHHFSLYGLEGETPDFEFPEAGGSPVTVTGTDDFIKVTSVQDGDKVIVENNRSKGKYVNDSVASNRLQMAAKSANTTVWTVSVENGNVYLKNADGKYLTVTNGQGGVSTSNTNAAKLAFNGTTWTLQAGSYYLNDYNGSGTAASGYNQNDDGSKWNLYEPVYWVKCDDLTDLNAQDTYMVVSEGGYALGINSTTGTAVSGRGASFTPAGTIDGEEAFLLSGDANTDLARFRLTGSGSTWKFMCVNSGRSGFGLQLSSSLAFTSNTNSISSVTVQASNTSGFWNLSRKSGYSGSTYNLGANAAAFGVSSGDYDMAIYRLVTKPPVRLSKQLAVQKTVTEFTTQVTESTSFTFRLTRGTASAAVTGAAYTVYNADGTKASAGITTAQGTFTLKAGQAAYFELPESDTSVYRVSEVVEAGAPIRAVTAKVNGTAAVLTQTVGSESTDHTAEASFDGSQSLVKFTNKPMPDTPRLEIAMVNKGTGDGTVTDRTAFTFTVLDENGDPAVYTAIQAVDENGDPLGDPVAADPKDLSITMKSGQRLWLLGLENGTYTVEESYDSVSDAIYGVSAEVDGTDATVTAADGKASVEVVYTGVQAVEFTNRLDDLYTVTFDFRDGTLQTLTANEDGTLSEAWPDRSRQGKRFEYWSTVRDDETTRVEEGNLVLTESTTLYAHWTTLGSDVEGSLKTEADFTKTLRESTAYTDQYNYENLFDIDLSVSMPSSSGMETLVLVFDLSSSMKNQCMYCGKKHGAEIGLSGSEVDCKNGDIVTYTGYDGTTHTEVVCDHFVQRLAVVQEKATEFINALSGKLDGHPCHVSVVGFNVGSFVLLDDADLSTTAGKNNVLSTISNLGRYMQSNTALSSGMYKGYQQLMKLNTAHSVDPANSCVLLLSDGVPTSIYANYVPQYTNPNSANTIGTAPNTVTGNFYIGPDAVSNATSAAYIARWKDIWSKYDHYEWVEDSVFGANPTYTRYQIMAPPYIAEQIRGYGSSLYTISLGQNMDKGRYNTGTSYGYVSGIGLNNYDYLRSFSDSTAFVNTASALGDFYNSLIKAFTSTISDATVTDPMSDHVEFMGFTAGAYGDTVLSVSDDGSTVYTTVNGQKVTVASYDAATRTITWNPEYDGTLSYKVRLKNELSGFKDWDASGADYLTNKETELVYTVTTGSDTETETRNVDIPYVHGWLGELSFEKRGGDLNDSTALALPGAEFTLHHDPANCPICKNLASDTRAVIADFTAVADEDGLVEFSKVPSGHTYTMSETVTPVGFAPAVDYKVKIAYGTVTVTPVEYDNGYWAVYNERYSLFNPRSGMPELPETGGRGTLLLTLGGLLLMAGACVYGIKLRRERERRNE